MTDSRRRPGLKPTVFTVGHSTRSLAEFVELLRRGPVELVVDVRTVPRSRRNPQYNEDVLGDELAGCKVSYLRISDLGGFRGRSPDVPPEVNAFWKNQSFHNYADYALSAQFAAALGDLLQIGSTRRCTIMCSEAVWWRCHRRIIADYLIAHDCTVFHLMGDDRIDRAQLTPSAKMQDGKIIYPRER